MVLTGVHGQNGALALSHVVTDKRSGIERMREMSIFSDAQMRRASRRQHIATAMSFVLQSQSIVYGQTGHHGHSVVLHVVMVIEFEQGHREWRRKTAAHHAQVNLQKEITAVMIHKMIFTAKDLARAKKGLMCSALRTAWLVIGLYGAHVL
jgi:hypothetical protein